MRTPSTRFPRSNSGFAASSAELAADATTFDFADTEVLVEVLCFRLVGCSEDWSLGVRRRRVVADGAIAVAKCGDGYEYW